MQLGLVQWNGIGAAANTQGEAVAAMGCQPGMTIPRSCVKVKSTRAWKLNTVDRPFGRDVPEGSNMCLIFPVSNMNKMNRNLLKM